MEQDICKSEDFWLEMFDMLRPGDQKITRNSIKSSAQKFAVLTRLYLARLFLYGQKKELLLFS